MPWAVGTLDRTWADCQQTLDPDLDTIHMMNIAVLRRPLQAENTTILRELASQALASKALTPVYRDLISHLLTAGVSHEFFGGTCDRGSEEGIRQGQVVGGQAAWQTRLPVGRCQRRFRSRDPIHLPADLF